MGNDDHEDLGIKDKQARTLKDGIDELGKKENSLDQIEKDLTALLDALKTSKSGNESDKRWHKRSISYLYSYVGQKHVL
jgi:hypothetical protein